MFEMIRPYMTWLIHTLWHDSFIRVTSPIHTCDMTQSYVWHAAFTYTRTQDCIFAGFQIMTHSYVWHDSFACVAWLIHTCDSNDVYVTWLIYMCNMTHSYVWHDTSICTRTHGLLFAGLLGMTYSYVWHNSCIHDMTHSYVTWIIRMLTWLIHMCDMTQSYWWHDRILRTRRHCLYFAGLQVMTHSYATWLIHMCDILIHIWHDSFVCDTAHSYVTRLIHMWDMTHSYVRHDSFIHETH